MSRAPVFRAVFRKELRHGWRDRSVLILVFLVPLLLAGITTLAFSRIGSAGATTLGTVDNDHGRVAGIFLEDVVPGLRVGGKPLVKTVSFATEAEAKAATKNGRIAAAIILPAGLTAKVNSGNDARLTLITGADSSLGTPVAQAMVHGFSAQIAANRLSFEVASTGPGGQPPSERLRTAAADLRSPVTVDNDFTGARTLSPASYFAPSMVILALFFCGQIAARGLLGERKRRTLARMVLSSAPAWRVLMARYTASLVVGLAGAAVVLGVFGLFGASFGSTPVLVLLVLVTGAAMISVSSLVVLIATTEEQAGNLGTVMAFVLAILGGNFVPPSQSSQILRQLALFTPNGWAVRAFTDLSVAAKDPLTVVAPSLLVLIGFTVVAGVPSVLLSRRMLRSSHA
ncbi:ABC-type multidrug transport system, permease component [Streptomyces sp. DvalAA-14]|uniref:ABC transporter permease n=1 Tax=unclassified Streptomyces TaxID=2593676 RepID=UPI00081B319C|nr:MULTISPECIES: ABC transporter permease [unclassified Streptomyces]MYS21704.1 ABC transporter permease [Streptomyces sp. SID4948]SCD99327.1 ABC-type multidrug transport system, permease component [Streptomyces sp. DvalAA-14]